MAITGPVTVEQLIETRDAERYELIRGELRYVQPADMPHGFVMGRLFGSLGDFVLRRDLGAITGGRVGIVLERDPDTVLGADVAFTLGAPTSLADIEEGYLMTMSHLVIEVGELSQGAQELRGRAEMYLSAGVSNVWLIELRTCTVSWIGADRRERVFTTDDILDGGDLLPGFRLAVADIFR
jgi:Uma2 family endonuclease